MGTLRAKASETQIAVDAAVDSICNDFESTWRSGHHPRIEDFLGRAAESERERLLLELVLVEFELRRSAGESPSIEEYLRRFPEHEVILRDHLLRQLETAGRSNAIVLDVDDRELRQGDYWGRYQLLALLGRGGFGEVWRARDPVLQRDVALKMLRSDKPISPELNHDLVREGQRVAQLDHEHIVRVLHAEIVNGRAMLVSDLKEGGTLLSRLQDGSTIDRETAVQWMIDVALALQSAHEKRIVHRDLKPSNLLFDHKGNIYVADFGLAVSEVEQLSEPSGMMGTWAYASPEQAGGEARLADPRSDLYSLGVIFYQLLTGRLPFVAQPVEQYKRQILEREPRPPRSMNPEIPVDLETICLGCLRKEIANRPGSAQEVADRLQEWVTRRNPTEAARPSPILLQTELRRHPINWPIALSVAIAGGGILATAAFLATRFAPQLDNEPGITQPDRIAWTNPIIRVWSTADSQVDQPAYDEALRQYEFDSHFESLFEVGTCTRDALTIRTRMQIHGYDRLGRGGVFWGWNQTFGEPPIHSCCWGIEVGRLSADSDDHVLIRQYEMGADTGGHHIVLNASLVAAEEIPPLTSAQFELRAEVTPRHVEQIYVNGHQVLDHPVELAIPGARPWQALKDSGYGFLGNLGTFSVQDFVAD